MESNLGRIWVERRDGHLVAKMGWNSSPLSVLLPKLPALIREKVLEIERLAEARARQGATVDQGSVGGGDGDSETVLPRRLDDTKGAVGLRSALNRAVVTAATR